MNKDLMREIARQILADVGAAPGTSFGKVGLPEKVCASNKEIILEYDEGSRQHDTFAGEIKLGDSIIRAFLVDLTDDAYEFLLVYRFDGNPIHSVSSSYGYDDDNSYIREYDIEKKSWKAIGIKEQANMLIGFEKIVSYGLVWNPCDSVDDLYDAALTLVS